MQCWLRPPLTRRDCVDDALLGRGDNMTPRIPKDGSIDWSLFVIKGNTMPPRDPEDDEDEEDEEEDRADEPPVVREPDED
jgi:hypothetical protein